MSRKPKVSVQVTSHGRVVYSARATAITGNTLLDVNVPQDPDLQAEIADLFLMLAHDMVKWAWQRTKIMAILGAGGTTEPRSISGDEYRELLNGGEVGNGKPTDDMPF